MIFVWVSDAPSTVTCSQFAISDPSLPFLLLSDFDCRRGDGCFQEEDGAFDNISGNCGYVGRNGFVHKGDPFMRVPSRASVTWAPPLAQSRHPVPIPTRPSTSAAHKRRPTTTMTSSPSGGTPLTLPRLAQVTRSAAERAR